MLTADFDRWTPDQRAGRKTGQHHGSRDLVHVDLLFWPSVKKQENNLTEYIL